MLGTAERCRPAAHTLAITCALTVLFALSGCGDSLPIGDAIDADSSTAPLEAIQPPSSAGSDASATPERMEARTPPPTAAAIDSSNWVLAPPFYAAGDEPFWRLDLIDGWFVFKRSGLPEIEAPIVPPAKKGAADVFASDPLTISISRGACQIEGGGQGDANASVTFDGIEFGGCAFGGAAGVGSAEAGAVAEAVAAVDACLARLGQPAIVTAIYPREGGRTALGLRSRDGSLYECAAEADTGEIAFLDPIEPGAAGAWMTTRMRFLRTGASPGVSCKDAEEVRLGDTLIGVLLTPKCKF